MSAHNLTELQKRVLLALAASEGPMTSRDVLRAVPGGLVAVPHLVGHGLVDEQLTRPILFTVTQFGFSIAAKLSTAHTPAKAAVPVSQDDK